MGDTGRIIRYAEACLALGLEERPELVWLRGIYDRFRASLSVSGKGGADGVIYERMYARAPEKPSDTLKIRYWRTGRHTPVNREQCLAFGKALDMDKAELEYLIKGYFDRSDRVFGQETMEDPEYHNRRKLLDDLVKEYLQKVHPGRMLQMKISKGTLSGNIRHLYYTDALKYTSGWPGKTRNTENSHIISVNYGSELVRNFRLEGEIPRRTMLRHLLLLGMPYISRKLIDERLEALGYLPLQEQHTLVGKEHLDWLLIKVLDLYEERCTGRDPEYCCRWFQSVSRVLDQYFEEKGKDNLRLMYFKALKE